MFLHLFLDTVSSKPKSILGHGFPVRQMHSHTDQQRSCFLGAQLLTKVRNDLEHILAADYEDCLRRHAL